MCSSSFFLPVIDSEFASNREKTAQGEEALNKAKTKQSCDSSKPNKDNQTRGVLIDQYSDQSSPPYGAPDWCP